MKKFHVNPKTGNPGACSASEDKCPFGDANEHYSSADAARAAYEAKQKTFPETVRLKSLEFGGNTWKNVTLEGSVYQTDRTMAIVAYVDDGYGPEPLTDVSVNLSGLGVIPQNGAFFVKDWSENAGLAAALEKAGIVTPTGRTVEVNQWGSKAVEVELNDKYQSLATVYNEKQDDVSSLSVAAQTVDAILLKQNETGTDYSVSFKTRKDKTTSAQVLSDGEIYDIDNEGNLNQKTDPRKHESLNSSPRKVSPKMELSLKAITRYLLIDENDFAVGFSSTPFGNSAETISITSKDTYFTVLSNGSYTITPRGK